MKYTPEQSKYLKDKCMNGFTKHNPFIKKIIIKDGFYIVESKMNK